MDALKALIARLPKKITIAVVTAAVMFARPYLLKLGIEITDDEMNRWIALAVTLIIGIAAQDHGKEAAKIDAKADADARSRTASGEIEGPF